MASDEQISRRGAPDSQQYDFFDSEKIDGAIRYINLGDDMVAGNLEKLLERISAAVEAYSPGLVFVDSLRSLAGSDQAASKSFPGLQDFFQRLGVLMSSWQATTFLIGEYRSPSETSSAATVADGLIELRQSVHRNSVVRQIEIVTMRGLPTMAGLHTFRIDSSGIKVFAPAQTTASVEPGQDTSSSTRLSLGLPGLDDLMGGGLPRGYSLLVAGPSGSGKSILAFAFLAEGARLGEIGVIAAFEQRPNLTGAKVVDELIASDKVTLIQTREADLSVDEIAMLLINAVRRRKASRVVIDSLSGFELALAPTFREDFRESMSRMVAALASTGATVLMTSELEDRYMDLRFSPYGTAFMTDAIIVQRYIEIDSQLQRVMAVVKVRASAHSNDLRLYNIDANGIHIGDRLADREGLLGGSPQESGVRRCESR